MKNTGVPVSALAEYLKKCRWFGGKARKIKLVKISESIVIGKSPPDSQILFLDVEYTQGASETYLLPISFAHAAQSEKIIQISRKNPAAVIAHAEYNGKKGIFYDAVYNEKFRKNLFLMIAGNSVVKGNKGAIVGVAGKSFKNIKCKKSEVLKAEHSNTGLLYDGNLFLKLYRRLDKGLNPDPEILRFLTEKTNYKNAPVFSGSMEYREPGFASTSVGMMHVFVFGKGDAWTYTLGSVEKYFKKVLLRKKQNRLELKASFVRELTGGVYPKMAAVLGRRTAELHLALSSGSKNPDFSPEPFTGDYRQSVFQSMKNLTQKIFNLLRENPPAGLKKETAEILNKEKDIVNRCEIFTKKNIDASRIRIHGDYHLGQVLYTGNDFFILDFEGEPARSIDERRMKRSPVVDIAGMVRSFHYAAYHSLLKSRSFTKKDVAVLEPWADLWYDYISEIFLKAYLETAKNALFIPKDKKNFDTMLNVFLLEKAVYELGYELNNRPEWACIPLKAIKQLTRAH